MILIGVARESLNLLRLCCLTPSYPEKAPLPALKLLLRALRAFDRYAIFNNCMHIAATHAHIQFGIESRDQTVAIV